MTKALKKCVAVTWFSENQPGFLDFSYRTAALSKTYQLTIVSQHTITQAELLHPSTDYKVFNVGGGKLGWLTYIFSCSRYIKQQKADVVVLLHSGVSSVALLIGAVPSSVYWNEHPSHLASLPYTFSPLRYMVALAMQNLLFLGAKKATLVMPIGEEHRDDLLQHGVKNIQMIYMGVADCFLPSANTPEINVALTQTLKLIYIGSVMKERGRDVMLEAMSLVAQQKINTHLSIIGGSEEQLNYCKTRIDELNIADYVNVTGRVPGSQVPSYLAQADAGICLWEDKPWYRFNPPTKLFEYLVAGLPVLASNIRTHTRYVQNWHNGLIFDYNPQSLAGTIIELEANLIKLSILKRQTAKSGETYIWSKIEPVFLNAVNETIKSTNEIK